jgi:hypothetical protein
MANAEASGTRWVRASFALALVVAGCGGGGADPAPVERSSLQKQCDSLMAAWCESSTACIQDGLAPEDRFTESELSYEQDFCLDKAKRTCDAAIDLGEQYDECRASVETLGTEDCETIRAAVAAKTDVAMPSSCEGLFAGN